MAKDKENIPEKIKEAFKEYYNGIKGTPKHLGIFEGVNWFSFNFKEPVCLGFPVLFGIKENKIQEATDNRAINILNLFIKD